MISQKLPNCVNLNSISEGKKSHNCTICDYITSHKGHLNQHIELVHGGIKHVENTATHHCEICNKDFSKKHGLENHMKWHIKAAHERTNEHYAQVHEDKKESLSFKCTFCYRMDPGYRMRSPESLLDEIEMLHKDYGITYIAFQDDFADFSYSRTNSFALPLPGNSLLNS